MASELCCLFYNLKQVDPCPPRPYVHPRARDILQKSTQYHAPLRCVASKVHRSDIEWFSGRHIPNLQTGASRNGNLHDTTRADGEVDDG
eukprot:m.1189858 g.1189858  ORF g.1189858 m.1189858 type:complete len:89 (-) comp24554_c3_seq54:3580-3846(-)